MANNTCTASVKELIENVKGTPYGVEVRRSKKGKPQAISFNETVDSFKDVIEDDCSNADRHGRFADTPASEGGAVAACEQYEAEKAPCFSVGGKIKSTTVLKSRLAKKYKEKDSYADYEDNKYKAIEGKKKIDIDELINFRVNYYSQILSYFTGLKIAGSGHFFSINGNGKFNRQEIEEKFIQDIQRDKGRETDNPRLTDTGYKKAHRAINQLIDKTIKGSKRMKLDDLKEFKDDLMNHLRGKKKSATTPKQKSIQWNNFVNILARFAKSSSTEKMFTKKVFDYYKKSSLSKKKLIRDFFYGGDELDELAVKEYYPRIKDKVTPAKSTPVKTKKLPTPKAPSAIPSEIYYQKTADGKCILFLTKAWYNKMYPQYQAKIKEFFKWNPYDKVWTCKKKNAESILNQLGIPQRNNPIKVVTPERVKPSKKKFALATQERSIGQSNQQQLGLSFVSRLERLESNEKSIANVILAMKPKIDKIEEDVEVIKQIVEVEHHNKALHGDIF